MKIYCLIAFCVNFFMSLPAFAHAGHDHSSLYAHLVHALWLVPALMVLVFVYRKLLKNNYQI